MTDAYDPATRPCSGRATKGCTALHTRILAYWPTASDLGTYICRPTADGAPSVHGNGRAGDVGPGADPCANIAAWLVKHHTVLGVQLVIWNHRIWSVARSGEGWRPYGCDKPGSDKDHHTGHVHWEINVDAGDHLTAAIIDSVRPDHPGPPPIPQPEEEMPDVIQCRDHPEKGEYVTNHVNSLKTATQAQLIHGRNLGKLPKTTLQVPHDYIAHLQQVETGHHIPGDV